MPYLCSSCDYSRCYDNENEPNCFKCGTPLVFYRWCECPRNLIHCYSLPDPYSNIFIGSDPRDGMTPALAMSFQAIVNVSDAESAYFDPAFPGQRMHWTPLNELGYWGYAPFYYLKKVLDFHYDRGDKIYLHCAAGAYRSPSMAIWWLVSRGHSLDEAMEIDWNNPKVVQEIKDEGRWESHKNFGFKMGNIPLHMEEFYKRMKEHPKFALSGIYETGSRINFTTEILAGVYRKQTIKRKYLWPYYNVQSWWRSVKEKIRLWWRKEERIQIGSCSYVTKKKSEPLSELDQKMRDEWLQEEANTTTNNRHFL